MSGVVLGIAPFSAHEDGGMTAYNTAAQRDAFTVCIVGGERERDAVFLKPGEGGGFVSAPDRRREQIDPPPKLKGSPPAESQATTLPRPSPMSASQTQAARLCISSAAIEWRRFAARVRAVRDHTPQTMAPKAVVISSPGATISPRTME